MQSPEQMAVETAVATTCDTVAIGCSAGGIDALTRIVQQFPGDLPSSVLIVQHQAPRDNPYLVPILRRSSQLPITWAEQGARISNGQIYVAPPDTHLLVTDGHIRLTRGPRENHARPSINKLFRSAAAARGSSVVGVLLTGMLDDGVAGLIAIRDAGGYTIVQDPAEAEFPELPRRAVQAFNPDSVLPIERIVPMLRNVVGLPVPPRPIPPLVVKEAEFDQLLEVERSELDALGNQSTVSCPDCKGPLWEVGPPGAKHFRCYLGHVSTARSLLDSSGQEIEAALWSAVRALNDRAASFETLAKDAVSAGNGLIAQGYTERAKVARKHADLARTFMLELVDPQRSRDS